MLKDIGIATEQYKIASFQMDEKGLASLPAIAGLFQEVAGNHADAKGFGFEQMFKKGCIWVLSRLRIEIERMPRWGEQINISSWVVSREKNVSRRDFIVKDAQEHCIISAMSGWMLIDLKTKRPAKLENIEMKLPVLPDNLAIKGDITKIALVDIVELKSDYMVKYSDLDINKHVNNVQYIRIFQDAFPYNWIKSKKIKSFEINYLAEAAIADALEIVTGKAQGESDKTFGQEIIRRNDNKVICRAKTEWI